MDAAVSGEYGAGFPLSELRIHDLPGGRRGYEWRGDSDYVAVTPGSEHLLAEMPWAFTKIAYDLPRDWTIYKRGEKKA